MDLYIFELIAGRDIEVWRVFSCLNKEFAGKFNMLEYERKFIEIKIDHNFPGIMIIYILNGKCHKFNGPAQIWGNGKYTKWYKHGNPHRLDGPALDCGNDDIQEWWVNGKRHRIDGPAVSCPVFEEWRQNGKYHRLDGPAYINKITGKYKYWIDGEQKTLEEHQEYVKNISCI